MRRGLPPLREERVEDWRACDSGLLELCAWSAPGLLALFRSLPPPGPLLCTASVRPQARALCLLAPRRTHKPSLGTGAGVRSDGASGALSCNRWKTRAKP